MDGGSEERHEATEEESGETTTSLEKTNQVRRGRGRREGGSRRECTYTRFSREWDLVGKDYL